MKKYSFQIFADYFQFYLQDDEIGKGDLSNAWSQEAIDRLLALAPYSVGIGTVRNMDVPVTIETHNDKPNININEWDQVHLCSLKIDTGRIVIAGCTDYFPDADRIEIAPGIYEVLVCYKNLDQISADGLEGEDSYHIFLYSGVEREVMTIKKRKIG